MVELEAQPKHRVLVLKLPLARLSSPFTSWEFICGLPSGPVWSNVPFFFLPCLTLALQFGALILLVCLWKHQVLYLLLSFWFWISYSNFVLNPLISISSAKFVSIALYSLLVYLARLFTLHLGNQYHTFLLHLQSSMFHSILQLLPWFSFLFSLH